MYNKALQHTKYGIEVGGKFFVWVERRCSDDRERSNAHSTSHIPWRSVGGSIEVTRSRNRVAIERVALSLRYTQALLGGSLKCTDKRRLHIDK